MLFILYTMAIEIPYKKILIFLTIIGVILIVVEISRSTITCPKEQVLYRYLPRTFDEDQDEPVFVTDIFRTMFSQPGVWEAGIGARSEEDRKLEQVNKFFISQF